MLPATLLPALEKLPFHAQLMLGIIIGSGLACLAVVAGGALRAWWRCRTAGLPPLPPLGFPTRLDQLYTGGFCAFLLYMSASSLLGQQGTASSTSLQALGWGALLMGVAMHIAMYLPMLLRYGILHPWQRPAHPWWHYLTLPLAVWCGIYLSIHCLELVGFSAWLVRVTGCPEHQELVLTFSHGDTLQRLYIIICAALVAPVVEECCFRGFLYTILRRWGGCVPAALASSLLFGAIHASLAQMLPLTIFGLIQCCAYEKARSLWLPIAVHMLFNTVTLITISMMKL